MVTNHGGARKGAGRKPKVSEASKPDRSLSKSLKVRTVAEALDAGAIPQFEDESTHKRAFAVLDLLYEIVLSHGAKKSIPTNPIKGAKYREGTQFLYQVIGQPVTKHHAYYKHHFTWVSSYVVGKKSTSYTVLPEHLSRFIDELKASGKHVPTLREKAASQGHSFDSHVRRSDMKVSAGGFRRHAWWVNMKREVRAELFLQTHGVGYDYDIEAAKPALTLQAWKRLMTQYMPNESQSLPAWEKYVSNRTVARAELAQYLDVSVAVAKDVYQKLFNGAVPSANSSISEVLSAAQTQALFKSQLYKAVRADWTRFVETLRTLNTLANLGLPEFDAIEVSKPISAGSLCSAFYERLEDEVMTVVAQHLDDTVPTWFIHDGFMSTRVIDTGPLEEAVFFETGYSIRLERKDLKPWLLAAT